jgi:hypothetical protein
MRVSAIVWALLATACGASPSPVGHSDGARHNVAATTGNSVDNQQSISQQYRSLDEYRAFLERTQGPVDGPWYRQVAPGIYELQTGNLRVLGNDGDETPAKHRYTREQLEKQFGFAK